MVGLDVLPPRLAPGLQHGTHGFSNSLSLDPLSIFLTGRVPPAEFPTAKARGKYFLCFKKWPLALDKVLIQVLNHALKGESSVKKEHSEPFLSKSVKSTVFMFPFTRKIPCVPVVSFWFFMMPLVRHGGVGPEG